MKKIITLFTFIVIVVSSSFAQFTKGNLLIGGATSFESNNQYSKTTIGSTSSSGMSLYFNLSPQMGYFFTDNFAAGAAFTFSTNNYIPDDNSIFSKSSTIGVQFSPFARYYFSRFYGQASFDVGTSTIKVNDTKSKNNTTGWSLLGGYALGLSESVTFEPQFGFSSTTRKPGEGSGDYKQRVSGLFLRLGVYVYLNRK